MAELFACPCCGYLGLPYPAYEKMPPPPFDDLGLPPYVDRFGSASFQCCDCCGYEFGFDCDAGACGRARSFHEYLEGWMRDGACWFNSSRPAPTGWDLASQLAAAGMAMPSIDGNNNPGR